MLWSVGVGAAVAPVVTRRDFTICRLGRDRRQSPNSRQIASGTLAQCEHEPTDFPEGPRSSIDPNSSCGGCENRVDPATHRTPLQRPGRIQGAMHPASTFSSELAAPVVVSENSSRSLVKVSTFRRLILLLNNEIYVRVIRHRNDIRVRHECAGRVNMT